MDRQKSLEKVRGHAIGIPKIIDPFEKDACENFFEDLD